MFCWNTDHAQMQTDHDVPHQLLACSWDIVSSVNTPTLLWTAHRSRYIYAQACCSHQLLTMLLQLLTAGVCQPCLQALVLQLLLQLLKLLSADSTMFQLTDAPCPACQLSLCFSGQHQQWLIDGRATDDTSMTNGYAKFMSALTNTVS